ncbi:MAG: MFS transporter [Nannocystaceae bacterium]
MGLHRYFLYVCGQIGMMALTRYFFQWVIPFASEGGGTAANGTGIALFSAAGVGLLFFAFRIFDGITDPVAGILSDTWVRRGKQRRSLLWLSCLVPSIGLSLVFAPTLAMAPLLRWVLLGAGMFVFFVGYTFYAIPYWSLVDDYAGPVDERRRTLSNLLGAGVLVATAIGFIASPLLIESYGFFTGALAFAIPAAGLMMLPYFAQPPDAKPAPEPSAEGQSSLESLKMALRHRKFLSVMLLFSGAQMSFTVMTASAVYIATDLLSGSKGDVIMLLGPFLASTLVSFVAVPAIARRYGWERTAVISCLLLAVVYAGTSGLGMPIAGSPMTAAMILFAFGGPMAAVMLGLEAEAVTSCAREQEGDATSIYFGVFNFIVKGLNGVALFVTGVLVDLRLEYATGAVRAMGLTAGALLVLGVAAYYVTRPKRS